MCEWRVFLPMLLPTDSTWIKDTAAQEQYEDCLTKLDCALNAHHFAAQGNDYQEKRTDRYYVGTDDIGLKHRAGKNLEVKVRDSVSQIVTGGEYWNKFKLRKGAKGASKHQADIDHSTERHELVDVVKARRRHDDRHVQYEKTTVQIEFPVTEPANVMSRTYYCGRTWLTICLEGDDARVLHELESAGPASPLGLLRDSLAACLHLRYHRPAHSCRESFFPVLAGYPTFLRLLSRPACALQPAYIAPLLSLLGVLPGHGQARAPTLPAALYAPHAAAHPLIACHLDTSTSTSARVVPYVSRDLSCPSDAVDPIRARRGGGLLNLDRALLHSPRLAQGWNALFGELRGSHLSAEARHRELAICVVAVLNEAEYEFQQHRVPWTSAGGSEEQALAVRLLGEGCHDHFLQARREGSPLLSWSCFDSVELDVIQLTVEMTMYVKTTPALMARLQETLGGSAALVEMAGVIAGYNMVSRFLVAMDITTEGEGGGSGGEKLY